jgi:hypothetical protein
MVEPAIGRDWLPHFRLFLRLLASGARAPPSRYPQLHEKRVARGFEVYSLPKDWENLIRSAFVFLSLASIRVIWHACSEIMLCSESAP